MNDETRDKKEEEEGEEEEQMERNESRRRVSHLSLSVGSIEVVFLHFDDGSGSYDEDVSWVES
jgi:hypothetical protein